MKRREALLQGFDYKRMKLPQVSDALADRATAEGYLTEDGTIPSPFLLTPGTSPLGRMTVGMMTIGMIGMTVSMTDFFSNSF